MSFSLKEVRPVFITPDDYRSYWGEDLIEDLGSKQEAERFLFRVQIRLKCYTNVANFGLYNWGKLSEFQEECLCLALLEQTNYQIRSGDIANDSGYDSERGANIKNNEKEELLISPYAKMFLQNAGLWCGQMKYIQRYNTILGNNKSSLYAEAPVIGSDQYNEKYGKGGE